MKSVQYCAIFLLFGSCALTHSDALAQVRASVDASTSIQGSATTITSVLTNGVRTSHQDVDSYSNVTEKTDDNSDLSSGFQFAKAETNDHWLGSTANANAEVSAAAHARFGDIGVSLSGTTQEHTECCDAQNAATPIGLADITLASATAIWTDTISINDPQLPAGVPLSMRTNMHLDGSFKAKADGGSASVTVSVVSFINSQRFSSQGEMDSSGGSTPAPDTIAALYPVVNGVDSTLSIVLGLTAQAGSDGTSTLASDRSSSFGGDFSGSLHWGGIVDIEDAGGHILTGWTITSASGFDYTKPFTAPEIGTSLLTAQLLVAAAFRRGARRALHG